MGLRARNEGRDVLVMVSTYPKGQEQTRLNALLHEIDEQLWWVALGVVMVLMPALFATRRALQPLLKLSEQAGKIGPMAASQRLETDEVPTEIAPLIEEVNKAFDRA